MNLEVCIKHNLKGEWLLSSKDEILSSMTLQDEPLNKIQKSQLPVFGFQKRIGQKSNVQQYPVHYVILELDTPSAIKKKIQNGDSRIFELMKAKFWMWFIQFKNDIALPYWWMYITPSICGIRFVLKLDKPIENEKEYIHVVKSFLRILYVKTNGAINQNHFDILVNQGWFVPTFSNFFDNREDSFVASPFLRTPQLVNHNYGLPITSTQPSNGSIQNALNLTRKKIIYQNGQRNKFIFLLACNCNRFGISENVIINFVKSNFDLEVNEIERTIKSAYRNNSHEHAKYLNSQNL